MLKETLTCPISNALKRQNTWESFLLLTDTKEPRSNHPTLLIILNIQIFFPKPTFSTSYPTVFFHDNFTTEKMNNFPTTYTHHGFPIQLCWYDSYSLYIHIPTSKCLNSTCPTFLLNATFHWNLFLITSAEGNSDLQITTSSLFHLWYFNYF